MYNQAKTPVEAENPVKQYLKVLIRRKNIILLIFLVSLPFILIKAFSGVPVYRATTKLLIKRNLDPTFAVPYQFVYDPNFLKTQGELIKSSQVAIRVVESLNLDATYDRYFHSEAPSQWTFNHLFSRIQRLFSFGTDFPNERNDGSVESVKPSAGSAEAEAKQKKILELSQKVRNGISVESDPEKGNIVSVSFTSTSPEFASTVANEVASAYKRFLMEMKMETTTQAIEWMKANADQERIKLEASERKLREYKKQHDIFTVDDREAIFPEKISQISSSLTKAQADVNELEALYQRITRISLKEAMDLPFVAANTTVNNLRQEVIRKEQDLIALSKSLGPKHPRMILAEKDVNTLREKLDTEVENVVQSVKNRYELARETARRLQNLLDASKQDAALMSEKLIQFEILNRDVEIHRLLFDRLLSRIKEFNITETHQEIGVWMVESADTPRTPITQGPKRALMIGVLLSLLTGIGLALFLDYMDNTVKTAEDAETRLNIPILGMIPLVKKEADADIETIVSRKPGAAVSEAYKAIRTSILLSSPEASPETILITSMNQGIGKTVTSLNLAIALAQSGKKVLLVDTDMRRPRIHDILNIDNSRGLSNYLSGEPDIFTVPSGVHPCLDIAPAGPTPSNPSELLSSLRLGELVQKIKQHYDFVLFDSPPLLNVTDAYLISKVAEQTVLVVRSGVSTYESVRRAFHTLINIHASVLGVIINAVDVKKETYYYSRYYGSYGSYRNK